jgi:hypothetical protein
MRLRSSHRNGSVHPHGVVPQDIWIEAVPGLRRMAVLADVNNGTLPFNSLGRS